MYNKLMDKLKLVSQNKRSHLIIYLLFVVFAGLYVNNILVSNDLRSEIKNAQEEDIVEEKIPVNVILRVEEPINQTFSYKLDNSDTVTDLMNKIRDHDPISFKYEKTIYAYGLELESVNGVLAPSGKKWAVFSGSQDITYELEDYKLRDGTAYTIKLVDIE